MKNYFQSEIDKFISLYPNFSIRDISASNKALRGNIDIVDVKGDLWGTYEIEIIVPREHYPYVTPFVFEISAKVERTEDWHVSDTGLCCLDITHNLILLEKRRLNLISFYQEKIYPFFANHTYKMHTGRYANGDYPHEFEGVKFFYENDLGLKDTGFTIHLLDCIVNRKLPERNSLCLCGKYKYKKCHMPIVERLLSFGYPQLMDDLGQFRNEMI